LKLASYPIVESTSFWKAKKTASNLLTYSKPGSFGQVRISKPSLLPTLELKLKVSFSEWIMIDPNNVNRSARSFPEI
jgi:hypothetical protein